MLTPVVVAVTTEAKLSTLPYLIALASATNIGGVVSFSGNLMPVIHLVVAFGILALESAIGMTRWLGL